MGLSEEGEESILHRFEELCLDLNMDTNAKEEALQNYQRIQTNFTLEGDQLHWLACALYEACRRSMVPTVGRGTLEGNCVSLTRLLRSAKFSLIQFFNKMRKWSDMANLNQEFRDKVDRLERNFAVSTVIFKKFEPIFLDIFRDPATDMPRQQRNKKQRRLPCTVTEVFNFAWTMFVQVKGNFPAISDDLVNSYHLLLCCVDWFFANALLGARKDLLKPDFAGLPENYNSREWKAPAEAPCLMDLLCAKHDGLVVEAKTIKEHWWKPHIKRLFEKKGLKGKADTLSSILEIGNFEANVKAINNAYEEYVLSVGDFDERIFLGEDAEEEIGTPGGQRVANLSDEMHRRSLKQHVEETRSLAPATPLTGRRYLKDKDQCQVTPVSTATQSVSRLQALLSGRKTCPSDYLLEEFKNCSKNPCEEVVARVKEMGETFCMHYVQPSDFHPGAHIDFARKRLQLGESLYFKALDSIVMTEKRRLSSSGKDPKEKIDLTGLLSHDLFHRSLLACCLEIVIFSYNSQRMFPWIVDIFEMLPYHFYKVIEIMIRAEEGLSRDVVKHLNHIEESILECFAWRSQSPLWDAIKECTSVPSCEDVTPSTQPAEPRVTAVTTSPAQHPRVRSLVSEGFTPRPQARSILPKDPSCSPTGLSAADIFSSPQPGSAKRRLFQSNTTVSKPAESVLIKQLNAGMGDTVAAGTRSAVQQGTPQTIMAVTSDGRQILIPMNMLQAPGGLGNITATVTRSPKKSIKPKKTGSLALFFRKVYHLAGVRLRELCDQLLVQDEDLRSKMWTCFEHALTQCTDLMCDRHLDQLLMCAVYIMAKVTERPLNFQDIMKCYRFQPQAQSHVYRSVLLTGRKRHTSGSSNGSATSRSSTPTNDDNSRGERERRRSETLANMRSSSTLPVPQPNSQPPTPTRLGGPGGAFDFNTEERGDLIQFYNMVFTDRMRKFALKFSTQNQSGDQPKLSPLPQMRSHKASPRRVSNKHEVYISPHRTAVTKTTPKGMSYCINKSPARDLMAINKMIRMGEPKIMTPLKRTLEVDRDEDSLESPAKVPCLSGNPFMRRLADVNLDRQEAQNHS
ncbi:retinoblastoma-like protein 1 [Littorina saxatilis]|uniref:Retinoblastoma-like protein 1 n=1 Tax=Littorina saxatilis TaxID=31220 RepID=A0AAN9GMP2_9CAEN